MRGRWKPFLLGVVCTLAALLLLALVSTFGASREMAMPSVAANAMPKRKAKQMLDFKDEALEAAPMAPVAQAPAPADADGVEGGVVGGLATGSLGNKLDRAMVAEKRRATVSLLPGGGGRGDASNSPAASAELKLSAHEAEPSAAPSRAWFPETFLFEPLVVTDASGNATVPVRVPDRLTQWRVLALAHSREGAQAGATARFLGTLPTYVDPVVPSFLLSGDEVRLPVQVVNTTSAEVTRPLKVEANGAQVTGAGGPVRIPAASNRVEYVTLRADRPGPVTLRATLGDADALVRTFDVRPAGKPVTITRGGGLGAPRTFPLSGPESAQPDTERVRLLVYPGALALLRAELSGASDRGGADGDAYALALAGRAPDLLRALGDAADSDALRALTLLSSQRVLKAARSAQPGDLALFAEAAFAHPNSPVLSRLGEQLAVQLERTQRPDGTCQGGEGWTLQRVLVATADCVRAVRADGNPAGQRRAQAVAVRAQGAFERNLTYVQDGYTAAAILSSGPLPASLAEKLKARVLESLKESADGARYLPVEPEVLRADGQRPSETEATSLAVLALQGEAKAPMADLGSFLLAGYTPGSGWGDGRANLVGLKAALALFKDPLPARVRLVLERDGKVITEGTLEARAMKEVAAMEAAAPGSAGEHTWTVRAEPAIPGLGFSLALQAWVPWKAEQPAGAPELVLKPPTKLEVGKPAEVTLAAVMPAGVPVRIRHALPAGVQPDTASLHALQAARTIQSFRVEDGAVTLEVPAHGPGQTFSATYRVVPTLAGTLHAQASSITRTDLPAATALVPPTAWVIR